MNSPTFLAYFEADNGNRNLHFFLIFNMFCRENGSFQPIFSAYFLVYIFFSIKSVSQILIFGTQLFQFFRNLNLLGWEEMRIDIQSG